MQTNSRASAHPPHLIQPLKQPLSEAIVNKLYQDNPSLSQFLFEWNEHVFAGTAEEAFDEMYEGVNILQLKAIAKKQACTVTALEAQEILSWISAIIQEHHSQYLD